MRNQVIDGETGLLVEDPTDLRSFAAAIRRVLGDRRLAAALGEEARRRATARSLVDLSLAKWLALDGHQFPLTPQRSEV